MGLEIYPEVHENPKVFFNNFSPILLESLAHGSSDWSLPREDCISYKMPEFLKFVGELEKSTIEHEAYFQTEYGDLAIDEFLKIKYSPSSLTTNVFTWFTTLPPNSIYTRAQLERVFHEHSFRGETKVSLIDLTTTKCFSSETIEDYLNRFRQMKSHCYTQIPKHELVRMVATGLYFSICKKLVNQQLRDMTHLIDRVRKFEQIKYEKERNKRFDKNMKEKITYVKAYKDNDNAINYQDLDFNKEDEICVTELQPGPPYNFQMLKLQEKQIS